MKEILLKEALCEIRSEYWVRISILHFLLGCVLVRRRVHNGFEVALGYFVKEIPPAQCLPSVLSSVAQCFNQCVLSRQARNARVATLMLLMVTRSIMFTYYSLNIEIVLEHDCFWIFLFSILGCFIFSVLLLPFSFFETSL